MTATEPRPITAAQLRVLEAIRAHWREVGVGPSVRDLMRRTGVGNPNGVTCHLKALRRKGAIEWERGVHRAIWPVGLKEAIKRAAATGGMS